MKLPEDDWECSCNSASSPETGRPYYKPHMMKSDLRKAIKLIRALRAERNAAEQRNRDLVKVYDNEVKRLSDEHLKELEGWQAERNLARGDQERAEAKRDAAVEALRPFAEHVPYMNDMGKDDEDLTKIPIKTKFYRRAASLVSRKEEPKNGD